MELPNRAVRRANILMAKKIHKKLLQGRSVGQIMQQTGAPLKFVESVKKHFNL